MRIGTGVRIGVWGVACAGAGLAGTEPDSKAYEYRRLVMGAQARIVVVAEDEPSAAEAANAAFAEMDALDAVLSDWRVESEARSLGESSDREGGGPPVAVSQGLFDALERSLEVAGMTGGAFDVTVGPLVELWRGVRGGGPWPSPEALAAARERVDHAAVVLDRDARTARLTRRGMRLDFGGIGKGLACDRALAVLVGLGYPSALVELGGDVALGEAPPGEPGWEVRVACGDRVASGEPEPPVVRFLAGLGVATSGPGEQFVEHDGRRYSHIVDPRSGLGLEHDLCVTVVAPDAALADALASAISVMGARAGRQLAAQHPDVSVRIVDGRARSLFDGESLAGWTERGGRYDGDADWTVEDGAIVGRVGEGGRGGLLYTEERFDDFVFETEVKVDYPFDSGIFLRMLPRDEGDLKGAQVTIDYRPGGEICAIYADGFLEHNERDDLIREGEWDHFEVRCSGEDMHLEVWVNGEPVTDFRLQPGAEGFAREGRIGIQVHGASDELPEKAVRFRDMRVRRIATGD